MKLAQWLLVFAAAFSLALGGCGKDKGGSGSGSGSGKVSVKQDTPKATLETVVAAAKANNMDSVVACLEPDCQEPMKAVLKGMKDLAAKQEPVKKLVSEKFGKELADKIFKDSMGDPSKELAKEMDVDLAKVKIEEKGDAATATVEGKDKPLKMKKIGGKWYLSADESPEKIKQGAEMMKGMVAGMTKALTEVEKKIKDGTITKDKAEQQIGEIMMKALMPAGN
ncbi:MAG: hypothetical protein PHU85_08660 [Phycisphaerae bacterium]|nr:hypothetical protein [Phycisphaerae bacterium]